MRHWANSSSGSTFRRSGFAGNSLPVTFDRATNRRVLGSTNDLAFQAGHHLAHGDDLAMIAERLAHTPMSAIGGRPGHVGFPDMLARALLGSGLG